MINSLHASSVCQESLATSRLCAAGWLVTLSDPPITAAIVEDGARQLPPKRSRCDVDVFDASAGLTSGFGGFSACDSV